LYSNQRTFKLFRTVDSDEARRALHLTGVQRAETPIGTIVELTGRVEIRGNRLTLIPSTSDPSYVSRLTYVATESGGILTLDAGCETYSIPPCVLYLSQFRVAGN
jgi:hypothetical protein